MNLARSDTYINVYIPRADGENPRRFALQTSPVFNMDSVYKFSDQVVKDRPLFMGKKHMTMYDMLTKKHEPDKSSLPNDPAAGEEDQKSMKSQGSGDDGSGQHSVRTVSLDLDSEEVTPVHVHRPTRRFNEPLNAYVTNRKKMQMISRYEPEDVTYRHVQTSETHRKRAHVTRRQEPEEVVYKAVSNMDVNRKKSDRTNTDQIRRLNTIGKPNKAQSAIEARSRRDFQLPPISSKSSRSRTTFFALNPATIQGSGMPVRPSSKAQNIWRQSTELLVDKQTSGTAHLNVRSFADRPSKQVYMPRISFPVQ